ncbi:MAG TPA: cellulase family glycosylhydrolase [Chthoniobacteraceae bacterium]|nr:cellulase family glycosylhydrolase [Chthoniobacteraceae bacterium]
MPFRPWGVNYGNEGRLMEDFWESEWETIESDFREIKQMGGNVVRIHLQFNRFMESADKPNKKAFSLLAKMVKLAEETGIYLDITGLACYRPSDNAKWYDELDEPARWEAQATFWRAVADVGAKSAAVFCYDLMNEPISPGDKKDKWYSGKLFGGYDFIQCIARDPAGRTRSEIVNAWIDKLTSAIRERDKDHMITVGMLPWVTGWKHLSGFVPKEVAPKVDFISVHIYPKTKDPEEARKALSECAVGKPVVIEETFPLECTAEEFETFLRESRGTAVGWVFHYDGMTIEELDELEREANLTLVKAAWRQGLRSFVKLRPELVSPNQ